MNNKKNITIDIGNSRIKSGLFEGNELRETSTWSDLDKLKRYCQKTEHKQLGIVSVGLSYEAILKKLQDLNPFFVKIDSPLPIKVNYHTKSTLGLDRLVGAVGAIQLYPNKNILVIDMGSCITYDLVDKDHIFQGGIISPGLEMRMKAMADYTRDLPDIRTDWISNSEPQIGKNTKECLSLGSYNAIIHEMNGFIERLCEKYPDLVVILTGGSASHFESKLKQPIFADSFLVLKGLNRILNQQ